MPHPVIELLIARMKSHPEEFVGGQSTPGAFRRWNSIVERIRHVAVGEDLEAFEKAYSSVCLDAIHTEVMDELLNGDERRLQAQAKLDAERYAAATKAMQTQKAHLAGQQNATLRGYASQGMLTNTAPTTTTNSLIELVRKRGKLW